MDLVTRNLTRHSFLKFSSPWPFVLLLRAKLNEAEYKACEEYFWKCSTEVLRQKAIIILQFYITYLQWYVFEPNPVIGFQSSATYRLSHGTSSLEVRVHLLLQMVSRTAQ